MSVSAVGFGAAIGLGLVCALAVLVVPAPARSAVAGLGTALAGAAGVAAGVVATVGAGFSVTLPGLLPLSGVSFALDALGGLFVSVIGGVAVAVGVYGVGYARSAGLQGRLAQATLPAFVVAMLLVPAAADLGTFLWCWELMAVASLVLVVAEHRRRPEVAQAGRWYAVMTHLGFVTVLIGLLLLASNAADDSFAALRAAGRELSPGAAGLVFVVSLTGFGSKAGIVPLHAWLPRAHPEAPSHVSALMSAAMVTLGVYGLVRVGFDLLGGGALWWWLLVMALGALSAVHGILQAAMSTDLKRLLGYSTTENMGLVLVGIGAAGVFTASGDQALAGLALVAALLHVVNHAAFKTLLFLSAGSVLHATGSRDLDALGGLRPTMPVTTAAFGFGALAASALPPGTAFVSDWLLLQALIHGLPSAGTAAVVAMPLAVAAVALTTGLAVATFVKAFGVGFLAKARSGAAAGAHESPPAMLTGMGLAALACVVLALAPATVVPLLTAAAGFALGLDEPALSGTVTLRLAPVTGALSPLMLTLALLVSVVAVVALVRVVALRPARRVARVWDCGGGPTSARTEYTATSFAEPLQRVFDDVVRPEQDVDVTHHEESRYLVRAIEYRRRVPDRIEHRLYRPVLAGVAGWGQVGRRLATGSVHRYLGYGFYTVCGLLMLLVVTR